MSSKRVFLRVLFAAWGLFTAGSAAFAQSSVGLNLAWDPSPGAVTGYRVKYGPAPGSLTTTVDVGNVTAARLTIARGTTPYYIAITAYNSVGESPASNIVSVVLPEAGTAPPSNDFNGDGWADIVWQNDDGRLALWRMDGSFLRAGVLFSPDRPSDVGWKVVATGDFTGDGRPDLLWQHDAGWLAVWEMNGTTMLSGRLLTPNRVDDTNWRVAAAADVNGDGQPDIIWQHSNGLIAVWFMTGTRMISSALTTPNQPTSSDLRVAGAADIDGNGSVDLVLRNRSNGALRAWIMNGTTRTVDYLLVPNQVADTNWTIVGMTDVNRDGYPDLIWQHRTVLAGAVWLMNGTTMSASVPLETPSPGWHIVGPK